MGLFVKLGYTFLFLMKHLRSLDKNILHLVSKKNNTKRFLKNIWSKGTFSSENKLLYRNNLIDAMVILYHDFKERFADYGLAESSYCLRKNNTKKNRCKFIGYINKSPYAGVLSG